MLTIFLYSPESASNYTELSHTPILIPYYSTPGLLTIKMVLSHFRSYLIPMVLTTIR